MVLLEMVHTRILRSAIMEKRINSLNIVANISNFTVFMSTDSLNKRRHQKKSRVCVTCALTLDIKAMLN